MRLIHVLTALLILSCLTASATAQVVTARRIDARPPGHPLDTGSEFDPIMDDAFRQSFGTSASSATGACVIRVPDWIPDSEKTHPTAKYYIYFSGHHGNQIKMAWADEITGRWYLFNEGTAPDRAWGEAGDHSGRKTPGLGVLDREHHGGTITLDRDTILDDKFHFVDVYADDANRRIIMYFHNVGRGNGVATSGFGLNFNMPDFGGEKGHGIRNVRVTEWYLRSFEIEGEARGQKISARFGVGRSGFWRAPLFTTAGKPATHANADDPGGWWTPDWPGDPTPENPKEPWTIHRWWTEIEDELDPVAQTITPPELHNPERDFALKPKHGKARLGRHFTFYHDPVGDRNKIYVFKTNSRELPESVNLLVLDLTGLSETERLDPSRWKKMHKVEQVILKPETYWEGIDRAYQPSNNGVGNGYHFRDPYVFKDTDGRIYLFYSGKGEMNVGVAELTFSPEPREKSLRVMAPHRSHPLMVGKIYPIGWWSYGGIEKVDLEYSVDGKQWIEIAREVENEHYFAWTVPDVVSDKVVVRVRESGGKSGVRIVATSETFTITDDRALGIVSPRRGTAYVAGRLHYPAYWSTGPMERITFEYSVDDGPWIKITDDHSDKSSKRAQWNAPAFGWSVPQIESDNVRLRVSETGGTTSVISEPFSIVAAE